MDNDRAKETTAVVTGLGLAGLGLFCGLSLFSYSPSDVMDHQAGNVSQMANLGGLIGAYLSHHLYAMYGVGAWVLTICLLTFGAAMVAARSMSGMLVRAAGALLLTAIVCAWAGTLGLPAGHEAEADIVRELFDSGLPAGQGGLMGGAFLARPLVAYFGPVGVYLVLVAAGVLAGLMLAQNLTESALSLVGKGSVRLATTAWAAFIKKIQTTAAPVGEQLVPAVVTDSGAHPTLANTQTHRVVVQEAPARSRRASAPVAVAEPEDEAAEEAVDPAEMLEEALKKSTARDTVARKRLRKDEELAAEAPAETADERRARERREEAKRQAEAAEEDRLRKEREAADYAKKQAAALAKLEKERAAKQKERDAAQAKFLESMAKDKKRDEKDEGEAEPPAEKPKLPEDYKLPEFVHLEEKDIAIEVSSDELKERGIKLIETLWEFKIGSKLVGISHGPTVTMFELQLDPGIKVSKVISLSDNLAMAMKSEHGVRIIAPIPGKDTIGIEIPNTGDHVVRMRPILESNEFRSGNYTLPLILGRDSTGSPLVADLSKMPHLLIAGTTGSGKSVCVNSIILSLMILRRPQDVKLILVDPKQVEMTDFKGIPHLLSPVVTDMKLAAGVLTWAVQKMEDRYERMSKVGVRNIASYNKLSVEERMERLPKDVEPNEFADPMPYIVIIVDEFADLMMTAGKEIEQAIARLAQKARAAGIHVILATQRPSADVVTGLIKTNLPCRICFQVKSKIDSRIVLDAGGADKLAGKGDMLMIPPGTSQLVRAKGVYIADHEISAVVKNCKEQADPIYSDEIEQAARAAAGEEEANDGFEDMPVDDRFDEAVECFLAVGRASTSLLQRRLGLGYTRAAKICDQMESRGIIGPDRGAKGRELLITADAWSAYKRGDQEDTTWGKKGSKDNPYNDADGDQDGNGLVTCLDDVDGTREDEEGNDPEAGDLAAAPDTSLVKVLDESAEEEDEGEEVEGEYEDDEEAEDEEA